MKHLTKQHKKNISKSMQGKNKKFNISYKFLLLHYLKLKKSAYKIAQQMKCSYQTIYDYLKKYNIKIRTISQSRIGKLNPRYIDGRSSKKIQCIDCGRKLKNIYAKRCNFCKSKNKHNPFFNKIHTKITKIKISLANGGTGIPYENSKYPQKFALIKEQIRKRDNYTCQKCGIKQKNYYRKLDAHHIDYNKQNCNEDNLITLCNKCNKKANYNRDYWYSYFTYIMEYING